VRNLRELQDRPRLQATLAGPSKRYPSYSITSRGLISPSIYYYYITSGIISQVVFSTLFKKLFFLGGGHAQRQVQNGI
jgi:hypothetical protein